eukprot:4474-Heterococcus_DN1.PRE.3
MACSQTCMRCRRMLKDKGACLHSYMSKSSAYATFAMSVTPLSLLVVAPAGYSFTALTMPLA